MIRPTTKAPECASACQQAVDYGVDGEHSCSPVCVYLKKAPKPVAWQIRRRIMDDVTRPWFAWQEASKADYELCLQFPSPATEVRQLYAMEAA